MAGQRPASHWGEKGDVPPDCRGDSVNQDLGAKPDGPDKAAVAIFRSLGQEGLDELIPICSAKLPGIEQQQEPEQSEGDSLRRQTEAAGR